MVLTFDQNASVHQIKLLITRVLMFLDVDLNLLLILLSLQLVHFQLFFGQVIPPLGIEGLAKQSSW